MTNSLVAEYQALVTKKNDLAKQIEAEGEAIVGEAAKALFEAHPVVGAFGWTQYTPSFNDGEPCKFTRGEPFIFAVGALTDDDDEEREEDESGPEFNEYSDLNYTGHKLQKTLYRDKDGEVTTWPGRRGEEREAFDNPDYDPVYGGARDAVNAFVDAFDNELLEAIFGEYGARVTITRKGVESTEYDAGY